MGSSPSSRAGALLDRLRGPSPLVAVELRPPRSGLSSDESIDSWIDMQHEVRRLAAQDIIMFLTDNAVGQAEEENLRHLTTNLAHEIHASRVVPFLTCKHSLDYCLMYAARAASFGYEALTVLGGDKFVGAPRCTEHAYKLRVMIRDRVPSLALGGWANPHRDPARQVDFLLEEGYSAEFYLTQIVSHHQMPAVEGFVNEAARRSVPIPGVFGVFYYRSANPKTLARLSQFLPVPAEGIAKDFDAGLRAEEICAMTINALRGVGIAKVYVSNLGFRGAARRYQGIMEMLGDGPS
ncbi:MAG: hypothetical protein IH965_01825 [Gemmatimonadetes bacterium]|nr:hypothetical protein [Gemmatimonadota bacterium]